LNRIRVYLYCDETARRLAEEVELDPIQVDFSVPRGPNRKIELVGTLSIPANVAGNIAGHLLPISALYSSVPGEVVSSGTPPYRRTVCY
jgi:hypothetical protein